MRTSLHARARLLEIDNWKEISLIKRGRLETDMALNLAKGRPPELSPRAASALITSYFPFKAVSLDSFKQLPSYDDRNIYFTGALETAATHEPFVLKLYNCTTSFHLLTALNDVMLFLAERGIPCSRPLASRAGRHAIAIPQKKLLESRETMESDAVYTLKVVKFIPGVVMDKLEKHCLTPQTAYSVGTMAGRMDLALMVNLN